MKQFLLVCIAALSVSTTSLAANLNYCCDPQCGPPELDFYGFYVGGNIGVFNHTVHRNDLDGFFTSNSGWSAIKTHFLLGAQLGYDWQCSNKVVGLVLDWSWVNTHHRFADSPHFLDDNRSHRHRANWFTTIRARVGVTVCDALVYVTGGAAVAHRDNRYDKDSTQEGGSIGHFRDQYTRWGWAGGVGTEFLLGCNWSVGAEILCLQFKNRNKTFTTDDGARRFRFGASDAAIAGRILINYRFDDLLCCGL